MPQDALALGPAQAGNGGQAAESVRSYILGGKGAFARRFNAELLAQLRRQLLGVDRRGSHSPSLHHSIEWDSATAARRTLRTRRRASFHSAPWALDKGGSS